LGKMNNASGNESPAVSITFFRKLIRAAKLDSNLYEAIEHDPSALKHAWLAIIFINVCSIIGNVIYDMRLYGKTMSSADLPVVGLIMGEAILLALAKWLILTGLIYLVGVKIFRGTAGFREIQRTIAFAYVPVALQILLPLFVLYDWALLVLVGTNLWMIAALVIAVRQSLDLSTQKAFVIVVLTGIVYFIVSILPLVPVVY